MYNGRMCWDFDLTTDLDTSGHDCSSLTSSWYFKYRCASIFSCVDFLNWYSRSEAWTQTLTDSFEQVYVFAVVHCAACKLRVVVHVANVVLRVELYRRRYRRIRKQRVVSWLASFIWTLQPVLVVVAMLLIFDETRSHFISQRRLRFVLCVALIDWLWLVVMLVGACVLRLFICAVDAISVYSVFNFFDDIFDSFLVDSSGQCCV